ncbi:MAG TPA: ATP-binding protein, partial [Polyangiaceae bacterium]
LFGQVIVDRAGVETFLEEATDIVDVLAHGRSSEAGTIKRLIHTLKGNAACYGLSSIAARCHELEDLIAESGSPPPVSAYVELALRWQRLASDIEKLLGKRTQAFEIDREQYAALERAVRAGEFGATLLRRVRCLPLEATAKRLQHFAEQAQRIAARLDKEVAVRIEDHGVRLDHDRWSTFWSAFIHAVRNALDHGVESAEERVLSGKTAQPTLALRTFEQGESVIVEIADDGRGIDWHRVAERARSAGLASTTAGDLERALFVDGISTASSVSDVSGRGIGMGALLAATEVLGGKLSIESRLQQGTTVRFTFPTRTTEAVESVRSVHAVGSSGGWG